MKSKAFIRDIVTNNCQNITCDRFEALKTRKTTLSEALAIEQKYEIIISNYLDLEREAIGLAVSHMVTDQTEIFDFFEAILSLNKHVVNLLSSVKLYSDQISSHVSRCTTDPEAKIRVKQAQTDEYDSNFNYRFMEALRNHSQHYGSPVHRAKFLARWNSERTGMKFGIEYMSEKIRLQINKKFKRCILAEADDEIELPTTIRSYIESISSIHNFVRNIISDDVEVARNNIKEAIDEYEKQFGVESTSLRAYKYHRDSLEETILITLDWDDVRQRIQKKNRQLVNLSKRYASGEADKN